VIALLFDYIFRDASIPDQLRSLFGRLQVPIVKAALLDRTFSPTRSIRHGSFSTISPMPRSAPRMTRTIASRSRRSLRSRRGHLPRFRRSTSRSSAPPTPSLPRSSKASGSGSRPATSDDVAAALTSEESESDRSHVRAFLLRPAGRRRRAVRRSARFVETVWAEHMSALRRDHGPDSDEWNAAVRTLDGHALEHRGLGTHRAEGTA
jgi:hypothetical protein